MKKVTIKVSIICIVLYLCIAFFLGCSGTELTGSTDYNESLFSLTGKIEDSDGNGIPNLEVSLLGVIDTTDSEGIYELHLSKDSAEVLGTSLDTQGDTIFVKQMGKSVTHYEITTYTGELPDVQLMPVEIRGSLLYTQDLYYTVEAVVTQKNSVDSRTNTLDVWLNNKSLEYGGSIYMLQDATILECLIYVNVFDNKKRYIGRSPSIEYSPFVTDIHLPDFVPNIHLPYVSIDAIHEAKVNTPIVFKPIFHDNFYGGKAKSYLWDFGDGTTANGEEVIHSFQNGKEYKVTLTVFDDDDRSATTSKTISITNGDALITGLDNITTSINDEVSLTVTVADEHGVGKIVWFFGDGTALDSTVGSNTSSVVHTFPKISEKDTTFPIIVYAIDGLGDTTTIKKEVTLLVHPPNMIPQNDTTVLLTDSAVILPKATDSNGTIDTYLWDVHGDGTWDLEGAAQTFKNPNGGKVSIITKAIDNDGAFAQDTFSISFVVGPKNMILIPSKDSTFMMGSTTGKLDEQPVHAVSFSKNFYMDTTEVTQGQYDSIMSIAYAGYEKSFLNPKSKRSPQKEIHWGDAVLYCNARSKIDHRDTVYSYSKVVYLSNVKIGKGVYRLDDIQVDLSKNGYRLPTEAEWEYACRAGTTDKYYGDLDEIAWHLGNSNNKCHEVAQKLPNNYGLYDMIGNVSEWCNDHYYDSYYSISPSVDPTGPTVVSECYLSVRGGSYENNDGASTRRKGLSQGGAHSFGFRTVYTEF